MVIREISTLNLITKKQGGSTLVETMHRNVTLNPLIIDL